VFAWVFSVWAQVQGYMSFGKQMEQREVRIQQLEQDVQRYQVELEEQSLMLPAAQPADGDEAFAQ